MSVALDVILSDIESILEIAVEIDSSKRSDGTLRTWYFSTHPRGTSSSETPADTEFLPFLPIGGVIGPLSQSLTEDSMFSGLAANNPGTVTLVQTIPSIDSLSEMNDYVFAGYQVRIKIGKSTDLYADFQIFRTTTVSVDPAIQMTANGLQTVIQLAGALSRMLEETIKVPRYLGIPHCIEGLTATFVATAPYNVAFAVSNFTLGFRFKSSSNPGAARNLFARLQASPLRINFAVQLRTDGKLQLVYTHTSGTTVTLTPTMSAITDGNWHSIIWGWLNNSTTYLMVDNSVILRQAVAHSIDAPTSGDVWLSRFAVCKSLDYRLYNFYATSDYASSIFYTRSDGTDTGIVGLWRCDDNAGAAINDYSPTGSDAAITGTVNVDYRWAETDLGEPEIAGRPYPLVIGNVLNVRADLIDGNRERYRANVDATDWFQSGSNTTLVVRSQGTVLTGGGTDYTAPSNGGGGVFSTTSQEAEPITFDHLNNGNSEELTYVSMLAQALLTHRTRLTVSDISNHNPMSLLCSWPSGYHSNTDTTAAQALAEIIGQSGLHYREDQFGTLWIDMLLPPTGYGPYGEPCIDLWGRLNGIVSFGDIGDIGTNCTLCCWVKTSLADQTSYNFGSTEPNVGTAYLIAKSNLSGNYALYFQSIGTNLGKIGFIIAGTTIYSPVGVLSPFIWHFVAAVFDDTANTMKLYCAPQGSSLIEVASGTNSGTPTTNNNSLNVGGNGYPWISVQHLQVWRAAKSLADLQALMATPPVGNESNLLVYAPMNEGSGDPLEKVNGGVGTISGSLPTQGLPRWCPKITVNLDDTPSVKLTDFHHTHPAGDIIVYYARNNFPMDIGDIDTGVSQNNRLNLIREWNDVRLENVDTKSRFKSAKKIVMQSRILDSESAQRLIRILSSRFSTDNYIGSLAFPPGLNISRLAVGLDIGEEIAVISSIPSQLSTGLVFKVVSVSPNPLQLSTTIVIWR